MRRHGACLILLLVRNAVEDLCVLQAKGAGYIVGPWVRFY